MTTMAVRPLGLRPKNGLRAAGDLFTSSELGEGFSMTTWRWKVLQQISDSRPC